MLKFILMKNVLVKTFFIKASIMLKFEGFRMKKILFITIACACSLSLFAQDVTNKAVTGAFPIVSGEQAAPIYADENDHWLVQKAAALLQSDIEKVTGKKPDLPHTLPSAAKNIIIIGSLDKSQLIKQLVTANRLHTDSIKGKWEAFQWQIIHQPFPGVDNALVITGSDRRGTAYGVFELSKQIGVSPWYWWADVPVKKNKELWYTNKAARYESPGVTYRGIFINDEAPALSGWSKATFGGFNHLFYEKVFELILRLKGNYLWPAMWGNAFYDDDTLNPVLADRYGIVIGTSHHEPMLRAHDEWRRYGAGKWDYDSNENRLKNFWETGIRRMHSYESIVTVGMRGDGDKPMSTGSNISLLERIISDQRKIISTITGKDASATPQLWALYKEVQDYYDKGMRVPDDVTLLLCDDNWGNVRKLPKWNAPVRKGGYGMYYHFDYVGGPRNYKWINTNSIPRVWEQMHLTYEYGVNRIWIVNVGDIKPMELPISFFLDYAWDPKYSIDQVSHYTTQWAAQQFGDKYATAIGDMLTKYTQYNSRRKPELLSPDTYSLINYHEAETVEADYNKLAAEAQKMYEQLPAESKDAFDQLVLFPVKASANLNQLYITAAKNHLYAKQRRASTNDLAIECKELFIKDSLLSNHYNKEIANGKWVHMMDQTHIGYTWWQQPPFNKMPAVETIAVPDGAAMGVAIEGSEAVWPGNATEAVLPEFNVYNPSKHYIEIFNRGNKLFSYTIAPGSPWLQLSSLKGTIDKTERIWIDINWSRVPAGTHRIPVTITGPDNSKVVVYAIVKKVTFAGLAKEKGYVESNGYISMDADRYTRIVNDSKMHWYTIPGIGRTDNGITTNVYFVKDTTAFNANNAHVEYSIYCADTGTVHVMAYCSPTLPFNESGGLRYAISFDDEVPQVINLHADNSDKAWAQSVSDNIRISTSEYKITQPYHHVLKFWAVDPGIVLQKIVIDFGGVKKSYFGPPAQSLNK
jgi:hypothetical protein